MVYPRIFKKEFDSRLFSLYLSLQSYFEGGSPGNLFPCLYSVFSYIWQGVDFVYLGSSVVHHRKIKK